MSRYTSGVLIPYAAHQAWSGFTPDVLFAALINANHARDFRGALIASHAPAWNAASVDNSAASQRVYAATPKTLWAGEKYVESSWVAIEAYLIAVVGSGTSAGGVARLKHRLVADDGTVTATGTLTSTEISVGALPPQENFQDADFRSQAQVYQDKARVELDTLSLDQVLEVRLEGYADDEVYRLAYVLVLLVAD